ncbi:MAG: class D sortase [Thermoanaerobaculia bacterium]|jgi:sortase A
MTVAAKWLRRFELALVLAGVSLLGGVLAATAVRWNYQSQQELAYSRADYDATHEYELAPDRANWFASPARRAPAPDPLAFGRIEIPRIGVKAIVREGVDDATLALAVGHMTGTARAGERGNVVLAGHRDTFFRGLRDIRMNDRIRLDVPTESFEYRVVALDIVAPEDTGVLGSNGGHDLTLVTCYPFNFIGSAPNRFIVRATRIN